VAGDHACRRLHRPRRNFTTFDDQFRDADLHIRVLVSGTQQAPYELRAILTGPDGKETQRTTLAVPAHRVTARDTLLTMHAYPNEKIAPILGVYAGRAGSDTAKGTKSARWAEVSSDQHTGVRVEGSSYVRLEGRNPRVLPLVVGRSEKNRRPESPEYRLDTGAAAAFEGGFSVSAIGGQKK
jgi:beta-galactosidase